MLCGRSPTEEDPANKMTQTLNTVVFIGSARNVTPPWGGDTRLGDRVVKHVVAALQERCTSLGPDEVKHEVTVFDPIEVFGPGGALEGDGHLTTPHFFLKEGTNPKMDEMKAKIKDAHCYVIVSPEYNHSVPPALSSMMGHFGGSNYGNKPSGIIMYSASPWGGARGAVALRPFLSELGCLPVSAMALYPQPGDIFDEEGKPKDAENRMLKQLPKVLNQLEWMAIALKKMMESAGPPPS
jgi:NAD(P)H-dependent FMN reductase